MTAAKFCVYSYQLHSYTATHFNVRLVGLVSLVLPLRDGRLRCYCGGRWVAEELFCAASREFYARQERERGVGE